MVKHVEGGAAFGVFRQGRGDVIAPVTLLGDKAGFGQGSRGGDVM